VPEWVAENPNTPPDLLWRILGMTHSADWPSYKVDIARQGLANNPSTPRGILDQIRNAGRRTPPSARPEAPTQSP